MLHSAIINNQSTSYLNFLAESHIINHWNIETILLIFFQHTTFSFFSFFFFGSFFVALFTGPSSQSQLLNLWLTWGSALSLSSFYQHCRCAHPIRLHADDDECCISSHSLSLTSKCIYFIQLLTLDIYEIIWISIIPEKEFKLTLIKQLCPKLSAMVGRILRWPSKFLPPNVYISA